MMTPERMAPERPTLATGLDIPDFDRIGHYGADCGTMKPCHRIGSLLFPPGHAARAGTEITRKGRPVRDLTTGQGCQAARRTFLSRCSAATAVLAGGVCFETWATMELFDRA